MKRFLLIAVLAVFLCSSAFSESLIDLDSLSRDQMEELYYELGSRLWMSKMATKEGARLPEGKYVFGRDLPVASYAIVVPKEIQNWDDVWISIWIDEDAQKMRDFEIIKPTADDDACYVINNAQDGDVLDLFSSAYGDHVAPKIRIYTLSAYLNQLD